MVQLCEEKLILLEGFWSPLMMMHVNFQTPYFTYMYLYKLGITALGLCETLLFLHQDLVWALDAQKGLTTNKGPSDAACAAVQIVCPDTLEDNAKIVPNLSWVRMYLEDNNVTKELVDLCEEQLVRQAGFGSPLTFARTSDQFFTRQLLSTLGINTLGVREALLKLHADFHKEINKHAPFRYSTSNGANNAARAAVNAVLLGYFENTESKNSSGKKRSCSELTQRAEGSDLMNAPSKNEENEAD